MLKNTLELVTGDVIKFYGAKLRMTERTVYPGGPGAPYGDTVQFRTECMNPEEVKANSGILYGWPAQMVIDGKWIVQGNRLAMWTVVTPAT